MRELCHSFQATVFIEKLLIDLHPCLNRVWGHRKEGGVIAQDGPASILAIAVIAIAYLYSGRKVLHIYIKKCDPRMDRIGQGGIRVSIYQNVKMNGWPGT